MNGLQKLMAELAVKKLEDAKNAESGTEEGVAAFDQAMQAAKLCADLMKMDDAREELEQRREMEDKKQAREEEFREKESKRNMIFRCVEIAGTLVIIPVVTYVTNKALIKDIGTIEQMETFTSTPGRALSKMFKFGK